MPVVAKKAMTTGGVEGRETGEGGGHRSANPMFAQHQQDNDGADDDAGNGSTGKGAGATLG